MKSVILALAAIAVFVPTVAGAQSDTQAALGAPEVKDFIRVNVPKDSKQVEFGVDGKKKTLAPLTPNQLFVAEDTVSVVYENLNPFTLTIAAGIEEADDPSYQALLKVVEAVLAVPVAIDVVPQAQVSSRGATVARRLSIASAETSCLAELGPVNMELAELRRKLDPARASKGELAKALVRWRDAIATDGAGVRHALLTVVKDIAAYLAGLKQDLKDAEDAIKGVEDKASAPLASTATPCAQLAHSLYVLASLSNARSRLAELKQVQNTVEDLSDGVDKFAASDRWLDGSNYYKLATVTTSQAKIQKVTLKFTRLKYDASAAGISAATSDAGTATFSIRRYDKWIVEAGAGLITAKVATPQYGSITIDGKQFAQRVSERQWSWGPAVVGNFVCRCWRSGILQPMFQFGALPSKETPAFLAGGGFRVWGGAKGSFGISGGIALAWVKEISEDDLKKPVTGTAEIERNKSLVDKQAPYVMFQYQF